MDLEGKTAFITGAASGIGRATACAFARAGANVMMVDREKGGLEETADMVRKNGVAVGTVVADVTDRVQISEAVKATIEQFGTLDCAHNSAGFYPAPMDIVDVSEDIARRTLEVNYWATYYCMQAQIKVMLERGGGTIVNTSSVAGLVGAPNDAVYSASKHAVVGLTKSVALAYAARGVRINVVCPGVIETPMVEKIIGTDEGRSVVTAMHPIGRLGAPEEIANAVVWLSSPAASFVVATSFAVDGGFTAD
ncbi:SDR family NAD(P)-dependent oxidoreductase [Kineobactrum salinum]|uniref:SDR family NAD(P)-dependent oxidoreductase n=1 Tax=Kineobactrum salinum TaxID=2708301 RepID=UPI0018D8A43A|nr:glucose 1-dehydrogenase [Kineobactrum salinum]